MSPQRWTREPCTGCDAFELWYVDDDGPPVLRVCRCGHTDDEHLDGRGTCVGVSLVGRVGQS